MATKIPCSDTQGVGWESGKHKMRFEKKWPEIGLQKFPWIDTQGVIG